MNRFTRETLEKFSAKITIGDIVYNCVPKEEFGSEYLLNLNPDECKSLVEKFRSGLLPVSSKSLRVPENSYVKNILTEYSCGVMITTVEIFVCEPFPV